MGKGWEIHGFPGNVNETFRAEQSTWANKGTLLGAGYIIEKFLAKIRTK